MDEPRSTPRRASAQRIEQMLRSAEAGLTMRELRAATGLHENGLRRALARLIADGSVSAQPEPRQGRGRPALRYACAGQPEEAFRQFLPLLLELVDRVPASDDDAYEVGYAHGVSTPNRPGNAQQAVARSLVVRGFAPRSRGAGASGAARIALHRCPFRDAVTSSHRGTRICSLHHGLLAGVAEANGGSLESFVVNDPRVAPCELTVAERWLDRRARTLGAVRGSRVCARCSSPARHAVHV